MPQSRQLAAIMFTDIAGYTALMGEDEQKAFEILRKNRQLQKPFIEKYNGKWIKEIGDGVLASFSTVTDAVMCAGEIQKACGDIDGLKLRIGIHQGEVVFEDNDVFGDGVNIASRIQAMAPIGGIWVSESVHKNISNKKGINSKFVGEETLKNVKEPVRIYEVSVENFAMDQFKTAHLYEQPVEIIHPKNVVVPVREKISPELLIKAKEKKYIKRKHVTWSASVVVLVLLAFLFILRWIKTQKARNEWIPEIQKLADASYTPPTKTFDLAKQAEKYIPKDSALLKLLPIIADRFTFQTNPAGADVYWKDYNDIKEEWKLIGKTPLKNAWIPQGFTQIKIEKPGFTTVFCPQISGRSELNLKLDSTGKLPENMVKVNGSESRDNLIGLENIVGLEKYGGKFLHDFVVDKYEVTNKEYKRFVDAGGYRNKTYWDYPVYSEGKDIPWEQAMSLFVDKTGKAGPAGWEVGTYPDGKEDHPVTGICWYEAMAYAKYAGKKLPTVYHWSLIANTWNASEILQKSNFNGSGTVPVGSLGGISWWGVYDIAGNAREWCFNESYKGQRFILGGGWNDAPEDYGYGSNQPAFDRSLSNGFRCMKIFPGDSTYEQLCGALNPDFRDYNKEKPVNNETFAIFLRQYAYDNSPLNVKVTTISDSGIYRLEKIDMDAAYNKERLTAYLYLPKNAKPPYQTVVFFPGGTVFYERNFLQYKFWSQRVFDFLLKSDRAVLIPVLKGTYERGDELSSSLLLPEETIFYKNHVIAWTQDVGRSLDYLETRNDILHDKFGFFSFSWGSTVAPVICAVEKRIHVAVLHAPGLLIQKPFPEVDPFNFLPQIQIPILMLNGKNDTSIPPETSLYPMFRLLGTDEKDKKKIIYPGGHLVPRSELMKESLSWYDKYLGPVK